MRAPGLSFALLLTIALGVGSNASIFGFLQGLTHPASPFRDSNRIVSIVRQDRSRTAGPLSPDDYQRLQNSNGVFEWVGAARIELTDSTIDGRSQSATVASFTPGLAGALALPMEKGVVISHRLWELDFDDKDAAVGSHIRIDNRDFRIAGVAPEDLVGLYSDQSVDLWIQSSDQDRRGSDRETRDLWILARLRHGVSVGQTQTVLRSGPFSGRELSVVPFTGVAPDRVSGLARVGMFLNFSAGVVFFIACINVASILLGRALRRSHETSLRVALGAARAELLRDLFADSVVISIAGGVIGLLLGILTARSLPALLVPEDAERLRFTTHLTPILLASFVCVVITVLCGMMPVLGTITDRPWTVLQRETTSPSKAIQRLRSGMVLGQITACCMLVTGTALLLSGLHSALRSSEGQRLGNPILLTVQAQVGPDGPEVDPKYFSGVEQAAKSIAGLRPLAWTARLPGSQPTWRSFRMQRMSQPYRNVVMDIAGLSADLSQPLNNEPLAGRTFGLNDRGRMVAVVNEEAAAAIFGLQTAGVVIRDAGDRPIEIIGIVKRASQDGNQQTRPTIYYGYVGLSVGPRPIRDAKFRVPLAPPVAGIELNANVVSESYFGALGMTLIAGQTFAKIQGSGQRHVGVINQEAADLYFNGRPLGAAVIDDNGARTEIIGIVRSPVFGTFDQHPEPAIYFRWMRAVRRA